MKLMNEAYLWLMAHPVVMTSITLGIYHAASAFVGALEMPDASSGKWYRFFFAFTNRLAANYSRASASKDAASKG